MFIFIFSATIEKVLLYLDPVSQGAILQAILGVLLAITLFVRAFWSRIKSIFGRLTGKASNEDSASIEDATQDDN